MGRPKAFNEDHALDAAMQQFWQAGFDASSIQDLVDVTGVNRASLYATFGDKKSLFHAAVRRYLQTVTGRRAELLQSATSGRAGIEAYFRDVLSFHAADARHRGCLVTNTAVELGSRPEVPREMIDCAYCKLEEALKAAVLRGQREGEISPRHDARRLARLLLSTAQGLRVQSRRGCPPEWFEDVVEQALVLLD